MAQAMQGHRKRTGATAAWSPLRIDWALIGRVKAEKARLRHEEFNRTAEVRA